MFDRMLIVLSNFKIRVSNKSNYFYKWLLILIFGPDFFCFFSSAKVDVIIVFKNFLVVLVLCFFFLCIPASAQSLHYSSNYSFFMEHSSSTQIWSLDSRWSFLSHSGAYIFLIASVIASSDSVFGRWSLYSIFLFSIINYYL